MRLKPIALLFGFALLSASIGYSQAPSFEWVVSAATFSGGYGVAHDDLGNVYVAGRFTGTVDFDPGAGVTNLTSAGALDIYITKVDAAGNLVWARRMGGTLDDYSFDVFVDKSGNIYATGAFVGTADFDPGAGTFNLSSAGSFEDIFVVKLDTDGNLAWARRMGSSDFDFGRSITVSAAGNVITTGSFRGTVDFDPGAGTSFLASAAGQNDIFISKLDASGNFVWARRLGGTSSDIGYAVTVDAAENVFTTGSFSSTADFDPGTSVFNLTEVNNGDIFVSKLDGAGNFVWARGMGGTSSDIGHSIQVDPAGNVYTSGEFHNTVDFDPGSGTVNLVSVGFNDAFICKLDANGNYLWAKGMGGTSDEESTGLALDESNNVYATGGFESTVDFDPGPGTFNLIPVGSADGFVVKLDGSGDFVWAQALEGVGSARPEGIDVDVVGSIYTTGYFSGTVDFDGGPGVFNVTSVGTNNAFIHKMHQPPTITSFSPTSGPVGTTVIISGTNFSTTPANNTVTLNGIAATVITSSSTSITVTVPAGASTGPIAVAVAGTTVTSSTNFTVTTVLLPTIISFTPNSGLIGTTVTIIGTNFSTVLADNTVQFNGTSAVVTASTATTITVTVPTGATTGKITVTVASSTVTSSGDFTVTTSGGEPTISTEPLGTGIGGTATKNLVPLITTLNNNLDVNSITVIVQPASGAVASVAGGVLTVNYQNVSFSGKEDVTIRACDTNGNCAIQQFQIEVAGDIIVYNGISPNGDEANDFWEILYIDVIADTKNNKVSLFNRWGDMVWEANNYDNKEQVFKGLNKNGNEIPSGTYFYKIEFASGRKTQIGYISLKR